MGRQLVDEDVLLGLERVLHRLLLDPVGLSDEVLDDEEDEQGQDERLDDLEETAPGRRLSQGRQYRGARRTGPMGLSERPRGLRDGRRRLDDGVDGLHSPRTAPV